MLKKAIFAFKNQQKLFYDPSFLSDLRAHNALLGLWIGHFSYFLLSKNPRDLFKDW